MLLEAEIAFSFSNEREINGPIELEAHLRATGPEETRKLFRAHRVRALAASTIAVLSLGISELSAQTVVFNAPFTSISQSSVTYGQGIVADANNNLYITGTVNLLYLQRNANGTYTPASTKIDSVGGNAYGLAIDASNNLYRPDIAPSTGNPYLAKYIYQGVNSFVKYSVGNWNSANSLSSVAVDPSYNVYVLDAGGPGITTGSIVKLTPSNSCSSLATCTSYTQTTLVTDTRLHQTTGLSIDIYGNFYVASGPTTGNTPSLISNSTAAVYKLMYNGSGYIFNTIGSSWSSPAATAVDTTGTVWVTDWVAQRIYELQPASSSPTEASYTKIAFQSATTFACLRTLTVSKTGQLFGLQTGGGSCTSSAVPEVGGTAPHSAGTPTVGGGTTQEVDVAFPTPQPAVSYRVVTQGSISPTGFVDTTPPAGSTSTGTPYCTQGTGSGTSCAILATFYPNTPGLEEGAILVLDSGGNVIGRNYIYGVGYGSEAALFPGQVNTYASTPLLNPVSIAVDAFGKMYIADSAANLIRWGLGNTFSILAGTGAASSANDAACGGGGGLGSSTNISPSGIALDGAGNLYFADVNQNRVCSLNLSTGITATVAGDGTVCSSSAAACGDGGAGAGAQLALGSSSGLVVDGLGNLLIADSGDNRIRSVALTTGIITTVAGNGGLCSTTATCGDGGLATASTAYLNHPTALVVNTSGDYLFADTGDSRIRKVSALTSLISTVAGTGDNGFSGDGSLAAAAQLNAPGGLSVDAAGDVYIADTGNNRVRMVSASTGKISTIVGGGSFQALLNPVSSTSAALNSPTGIALSGSGTLYIVDTGDSLVESVVADSTALSFPTPTIAGSVDTTDAAQAVTLLNIGNSTLTNFPPGVTAPASFSQLTGNTGDCSATFSLTTGSSCSIRLQFYPQAVGTHNESFLISDNALGGNPSTQTITVSGTGISAAPTISISPALAPAGTAGVAYSQTVVASGGTAPYSFVLSSGSMPPGMSLSRSGVLSGTPTIAGQFLFTVAATDSSSAGGGPFAGQLTYTLTINQGTATVTLGNLAQTYTGSPLAATATTSPAGLTVSLTYNGSSTIPTSPGTYTVVGTINDASYQGTATGTLVIGKATSTITLGNLAQTYTGSPLAATATTTPAGLTVNLTYNGGTTIPTAAGSYVVVGTLYDANYQGTATGTLVIDKATLAITLSTLAQAYTGSPLAATATTTPAGLTVNLTYNGSTTIPTAAGTYTVVGTISDANYQGTATTTLVIGKAQPVLTWSAPGAITYGTPLGATQLNATVNGIPGTLTYSPKSGTVLGAGANQQLSVTFNPTDASSYQTTTASAPITVARAKSSLAVASSSNPGVTQNAITFTATASYPNGVPTGAVTFLDGTTPLGSGTLSGGVASFVTSSLSPGTHSISAMYAGDSNFTDSTSPTISQAVIDFNLSSGDGTQNSSSPGTGASAGSAQAPLTVVPGNTVTSTISIAPSSGSSIPITTVLMVTGLPPGGTVVLTTPGWTQLTTTSWTLPANATLSDVKLAFSVAGTTAKLEHSAHPLTALGTVTLCFLLLPFGKGWRSAGKRLGSKMALLLLLTATMLTTFGLTGCGTSKNGFFGQQPATYNVLVTITTGTLTHSTTVVLTVE